MTRYLLEKQLKRKGVKPGGGGVYSFSPDTWEAEENGSPSLRPVWSTEQVPGQPGQETLSSKNTPPQKNKNKKYKTNKQTNKQKSILKL